MCTVTVISMSHAVAATGASGFRLACNRDEAVSRPVALPPRPSRFGERIAMMPIDPVSGGTWIAANDAGLAMVLLNASACGEGSSARANPAELQVSRGTIIPRLIDCADLSVAARRAVEELEPHRHAPFRLVMTDGLRIADILSDGRTTRSRRESIGQCDLRDGRPRLFTSSGLGDELVQEPRSRLFESMLLPVLRQGPELAAAQDAYHRHSWPERSHLSVCMRRPGARTVSHTVIESRGDVVDMDYIGDAPDTGARPIWPMRCRLLARRAPDPRTPGPRANAAC